MMSSAAAASPSSSSSATNSSSAQALSFHHVSNYFSLPLSDAASALGVCGSVLKKLCHENGLERWPYRKYLAGKSIEEIRRYAARQKVRDLAARSKTGGQSGFQPQNKETSKPEGVWSSSAMQHNVNKGGTMQKSNSSSNTSLSKILAALDEFKHGFPSDGLSTVTHKWWGCKTPTDDTDEDGAKGIEEENLQSKEKSDDSSASVETANKEQQIDREPEKEVSPKKSGSLETMRKRIAEEGREALALGVYRGYVAKKMGKREKALLLRIFKSSLPREWISNTS